MPRRIADPHWIEKLGKIYQTLPWQIDMQAGHHGSQKIVGGYDVAFAVFQDALPFFRRSRSAASKLTSPETLFPLRQFRPARRRWGIKHFRALVTRVAGGGVAPF